MTVRVILSVAKDLQILRAAMNDKMEGEMKAKVLLFASFREKVGKDRIQLELSDGATASDVLNVVCQSMQEADAWRRVMRVAVNCRYVPYDTKLSDGDEIALIPPVAGG